MVFLSSLIPQGFLDNLWTEILLAIILNLIGWAIAQLSAFVGSKYTGTWQDEIFDPTGQNIIKRDEYKLRHNRFTNQIKGKINRYEPSEQRHRNWICTGVIDGDFLILTFWSNKRILKSNGCIYAKHNDDNCFEGFYLEEHNGVIDRTKIRLIKG